ncbi:hypothetical protein BN1080_01668 [Planococcus massiliensis]|uniref:DUF1275 domain-containing protein n=1 Tax=Planococcus massiliensis TaxID=1499687 RepID=A0A098EK88_9BACL|nr:YoaK family protein [Planococcus massiliensis]CEG22733.1 hypothetical protein BN1080_01668 [Planococcus massiliensis]
MKISHKKYAVSSTILTIIVCFLMGFIDAYTFLVQDEVFASAQTGNFVSMSAKLFSGEWQEALSHVWVIAGFAAGAFAGEAMLDRYKEKGFAKYRYFLFFQSILLLFLAIFEKRTEDLIILIALGLLAGFVLTTFRNVNETMVNNGIMTGNLRNLMGFFYQMIFRKDAEAKRHLVNLAATILIFVLGVGAGTLTILLNADYHLWAAFFISTGAFAWALLSPALSKP